MTKLAKQSPIDTDPYMGKTVRITFGEHAGRKAVVRRSFRGRIATPDHVFLELEGGLPGWFVSIPVRDVEVVERSS